MKAKRALSLGALHGDSCLQAHSESSRDHDEIV
jgi:hypothetical protein